MTTLEQRLRDGKGADKELRRKRISRTIRCLERLQELNRAYYARWLASTPAAKEPRP